MPRNWQEAVYLGRSCRLHRHERDVDEFMGLQSIKSTAFSAAPTAASLGLYIIGGTWNL
jgi:hypothetical protein